MNKPTYYSAIQSLVPNAKAGVKTKGEKVTVIWEDERQQPTEEAIQNKLKELEKQYADKEYQRKRLKEYNAIGLGEQLDMIYHDMDGWKARIKSIKDKYPKP